MEVENRFAGPEKLEDNELEQKIEDIKKQLANPTLDSVMIRPLRTKLAAFVAEQQKRAGVKQAPMA